jgi:hypothetical protein
MPTFTVPGTPPAPVAVPLFWLNFVLANTVQLRAAVLSVINVYYDIDIAIMKSLFLESDGFDYLNYVNNPIFSTLDVAKFTTDTTPPVQMQNHALKYVADSTPIDLAVVANQSEWLDAFRAAMEANLAGDESSLDSKAVARDMTIDAPFIPLTRDDASRGLPMLGRDALTETVTVNGGIFTPKPFVVGDIVYFDVTCTFSGSIASKTYRINVRARETFVQTYPMFELPPPIMTNVNMVVCRAVQEADVTVNGTLYEYPFPTTITSLSDINFMQKLGFFIIFSTQPITSVTGATGIATVGGMAAFYWLMSLSNITDVPATLTCFVKSQSTAIDIAEGSVVTDDQHLVLKKSVQLTLVDNRIRDSGVAYNALGLTRQQPYELQPLKYFQTMPIVKTTSDYLVAGSYFVVPEGLPNLAVTVTSGGAEHGPYVVATMEENEYLSVKDDIVYVLAPATMTVNDPSVQIRSCNVYTEHYSVISPLPVTFPLTYQNTYNVPFLTGVTTGLFTSQAASFTFNPLVLKNAIEATGLYTCWRIYQLGDSTLPCMQINRPIQFDAQIWQDAGFHEPRTSTKVDAILEQPESVYYLNFDFVNSPGVNTLTTVQPTTGALNLYDIDDNAGNMHSYRLTPIPIKLVSGDWSLNFVGDDSSTEITVTIKTGTTQIGTLTFAANLPQPLLIPVTIASTIASTTVLTVEISSNANTTYNIDTTTLTVPSLEL